MLSEDKEHTQFETAIRFPEHKILSQPIQSKDLTQRTHFIFKTHVE